MASTIKFFLLLLASFVVVQVTKAGDADITSDFGAPLSATIDENFFTYTGSLQVGFVDTTNKLYTQTLQTGDMFVFPKGLVHFQYNADPEKIALAISAFGSASAGTTSLPVTLFTTNIDENILAKSFKTDVATIQALKAGLLAPKP
ncbi:hypothetical protein HS088_TW09G01143 [Tripterygium wilfordii]|uniref:Germin-like protein n=1 Tax=Tripterygium wilfordii TaxID=458696 RepID=A0A7J7D9X9_TRIWF|nr:hypothetical protein HS088_TW09G01143 [Tripterygium wilfordii]